MAIQSKLELFNNFENRRLVNNVFALFFQNGINYLVPLLLIPYLTRVLGVEKFGIYGFACTIIGYFSIFVRYGFDYSATKYTALIRDDFNSLHKYFSTIICSRLLLASAGSFILLILCVLIDQMRAELLMFSSGLLILFGTALTPTWLFQGMESMKFMTAVTGLAKLSSLLLIIFIVKSESQYQLAFFFYSIGFFISGICGIVIALLMFKIRWVKIKFSDIVVEIRNGWYVFLSGLGSSLYLEANVLILGLTSSYIVVGYYYAATRIIRAANQLTQPFVQALFPYMSRKLNSAGKAEYGIQLFKKIGKAYACILLLFSVGIFNISSMLVTLYLGDSFQPSINNIKILSVVILIGGLNHYLGVTGMVNLGHQRAFARFTWIAGVVGSLGCLILSFFWEDKGASCALVLAEFTLFTLVFVFMKELNN